MAKFIEIMVLDNNNNSTKRIINVEQINYFSDASDAAHPKRIFINASNWFDYLPYTVNEFVKLIS